MHLCWKLLLIIHSIHGIDMQLYVELKEETKLLFAMEMITFVQYRCWKRWFWLRYLSSILLRNLFSRLVFTKILFGRFFYFFTICICAIWQYFLGFKMIFYWQFDVIDAIIFQWKHTFNFPGMLLWGFSIK